MGWYPITLLLASISQLGFQEVVNRHNHSLGVCDVSCVVRIRSPFVVGVLVAQRPRNDDRASDDCE